MWPASSWWGSKFQHIVLSYLKWEYLVFLIGCFRIFWGLSFKYVISSFSIFYVSSEPIYSQTIFDLKFFSGSSHSPSHTSLPILHPEDCNMPVRSPVTQPNSTRVYMVDRGISNLEKLEISLIIWANGSFKSICLG